MSTPPPPTLAERIIGRRLDDPAVKQELAAIDPSAQPEDDEGETAWASEPSGLELSADTDTQVIDTVFMFAEGTDDYEQFAGPLPAGIGFDWDRARIHQTLGAPGMSGPHHDRWQGDDYDIVIEYDEDDGHVTSVTVTTE